MNCNNISNVPLYIRSNNDAQVNQKSIGDYLANSSVTENTDDISISSNGKNAEVTLKDSDSKFQVPGFTAQKIDISVPGKENITINLFTANNIKKEDIVKIKQKLVDTISNLPPEVLEDLNQECKHILITNNIIYNKDALALAIGPLNQIFLSASQMKDLSEERFAETLVHENGHLVDQTNCSITGKATKWYKKEFEDFKNSITKDLGFDVETHSLDSVSELFADYYLNTVYEVSEEHRANKLFTLLEQYQNDVNTLSREDLETKYGDKTDNIIELVEKWNKIDNGFAYVLGNINSGEIERANISAEPLNFEQIEEHNNKAENKAKL